VNEPTPTTPSNAREIEGVSIQQMSRFRAEGARRVGHTGVADTAAARPEA